MPNAVKRTISFSFFLIVFIATGHGQELFPQTECASNIPKGVLGIRFENEGYEELQQFRSQQCLRFMYGISPKLMITESVSASNRHTPSFPSNFIDNNGNAEGIKQGNKYPYQISCLNLNIKYRFLSINGEKKHFNMSAYAERSNHNDANGDAEPSLMGDNGGVGAGVTATRLYHRFAVSAVIGGILPQKYSSANEDSLLEVKYGKALSYSLSFGLLCLPLKYKNYKQTSISIYAEFIGKYYDAAAIYYTGNKVISDNVPALRKGNYAEFRPSVQFIFNSNLRLDLSIATPIINRSYLVDYPVYYVTIQRNIYFN